MGVIKDGCISGVLPSSKVFAVNYPGYPSSMERALMTLGGPESIGKARESPKNKLELYFRPEDPYSHPAFGVLFPCNRFLLKISKHENEISEVREATPSVGQSRSQTNTHLKEDETQLSQGPEDMISADIVGHVSEAYDFNGMVDYQHVLAVHADVARKKKRNWADMEPQFEKHGLIDADQEDLMILLPPLFSIKNSPENLVLRPCMHMSLKKNQEGDVQHHWETEIELSLKLDFDIKDVPKKVNWEKFIQKDTDEWNFQVAVCKLFDERPIWIKQSLSEHLSSKGFEIGSHLIKRLLLRAAYYFSNGPFHRFYIRKGYDPRKDPESRIYQRIDFRVPPSLRGYCDTGIASGLEHKWEDLCAFRVFPYKCQVSLQLFELSDDYIQQEIRKPSDQVTCTLATGWFPPHILEILRLCVAVRFLSIFPNPGAESLLKSVSLRLEKAKRTKTVIKENISDESEHHQANRDEVHLEDKEMSNDEHDDDTEDDMDDENADEDFDAYEGPDMTGEGTSFLEETSYIDQENISKNYLQELFGSFPYNGGTNEFQDAENSDGEYQIFDQYSDGNDSDDDN